MKEEPHCVRNALLLLPTALIQEEMNTLLNRVSLCEEHIVKIAGRVKLGLGLD